MPAAKVSPSRLGISVLLLSCLMACNQGSQVEQVTFTSSLQGVLDMPEKDHRGKARATAPLPAREAYVDGAIAIPDADTVYTQGYQLLFAASEDTVFNPYFPDQEKRDALSANEQNWFKATMLVEHYLRDLDHRYFNSTDSTISLTLADEQVLQLPRWESDTDEGEDTRYAYEHYFPEVDFFLLRAQFNEGNCWLLVHRQSGRKTYISGLPHFSPDGTKVITGNLDLESGYSFNGLAHYSLMNDSLALNWELEISNWGPRQIKWLSDSSLIIEKTYWVGTGNEYQWEEASTRLTVLPLHR